MPRPQGDMAVAVVGAEVTVQQQLCSVLLVACPRPGGVTGEHHGTGTQARATARTWSLSSSLLTSPLTPWRAMTSPQQRASSSNCSRRCSSRCSRRCSSRCSSSNCSRRCSSKCSSRCRSSCSKRWYSKAWNLSARPAKAASARGGSPPARPQSLHLKLTSLMTSFAFTARGPRSSSQNQQQQQQQRTSLACSTCFSCRTGVLA